MNITKYQLKQIIKEELEEVSRDRADIFANIKGISPLQSLANEMQGTIEAASSGGVNSMEELLPILTKQIERLKELANTE